MRDGRGEEASSIEARGEVTDLQRGDRGSCPGQWFGGGGGPGPRKAPHGLLLEEREKIQEVV